MEFPATLSASPGTAGVLNARRPFQGEGIMLDVILDCFGALLFVGQAAWFLARGRI